MTTHELVKLLMDLRERRVLDANDPDKQPTCAVLQRAEDGFLGFLPDLPVTGAEVEPESK